MSQLSALKEDESQKLVVAYLAGRWAPNKGSIPTSSTRAYMKCASRFFPVPMDDFRKSDPHYELGVHTSERRDGAQAAVHESDRKVRRADGAGNCTEGPSSRSPSNGAFNQQQLNQGVREP